MDSSLPPQAPYLNTETSGDEVTESEVSGEGAVLKASVTTPTSQQRKSSVKEATGLVLPVNRIKRIAKQETSVKAMAADAAFMIAMAAELFLEKLAYKSATQTLGDRRATVAYNDVATSASQWPCCKFLQDIVPEKTTVQKLLVGHQQSMAEGGAAEKRQRLQDGAS